MAWRVGRQHPCCGSPALCLSAAPGEGWGSGLLGTGRSLSPPTRLPAVQKPPEPRLGLCCLPFLSPVDLQSSDGQGWFFSTGGPPVASLTAAACAGCGVGWPGAWGGGPGPQCGRAALYLVTPHRPTAQRPTVGTTANPVPALRLLGWGKGQRISWDSGQSWTSARGTPPIGGGRRHPVPEALGDRRPGRPCL